MSQENFVGLSKLNEEIDNHKRINIEPLYLYSPPTSRGHPLHFLAN